jgi:hypothetical protein
MAIIQQRKNEGTFKGEKSLCRKKRRGNFTAELCQPVTGGREEGEELSVW